MARRWTHLLIHHSVTAPGATVADIYRLHRARGFDGIGYHYVLQRSRSEDFARGHLKVGRADDRTGAHAGATRDKKPWNRFALGLCVIGTFHRGLPHSERIEEGSAIYEDIVAAVCHLCQKYHSPAGKVLGHRDVKATACPGDLFPLAEVKRDVAARLKEAEG